MVRYLCRISLVHLLILSCSSAAYPDGPDPITLTGQHSAVAHHAQISDEIPPTGSIIINSGDTYTNSQEVTLTLQAQDNPGGSGVKKMKFSNNGTDWTTPEAYATSKQWTLETGDGEKNVYVKYIDGWQNESQAYSDEIILDTEAPTAVEVTDDGENTTDNTQLHATWTASSDTGSGIKEYQYAIGTAVGATDIVDWASTGLDREVTRSGLSLLHGPIYYISVRVIDNANNISEVRSSDEISYGIPPELTDIEFESIQNFHQGWPVTILAIASDPEQDPIEYRYLVDDQEIQAWTSQSEISWQPMIEDIGVNTIKVELRAPRESGTPREEEIFIYRKPVTSAQE